MTLTIDPKVLLKKVSKLEQQEKWTAAAKAWRHIEAVAHQRAYQVVASTRADKCGLTPGKVLQRIVGGEVVAKAVFMAEDKIVYKGKTYGSLSAAAIAAGRDIGLKSKTFDGWHFWCVEKRIAKKHRRRTRVAPNDISPLEAIRAILDRTAHNVSQGA